MAEKKKQEKKKDGAQGKRIRPQGWLEARSASRSVRRLARVLRHNGEDAAKSFAVKHMLDGVLNRMLRSEEYLRFVRARSHRALTYPLRRAAKRAFKRNVERQERERLAMEQMAEAATQVSETPAATTEANPPVNRGRRRTTAAKLKPAKKPRAKAIVRRPRVIAVRGRVKTGLKKEGPVNV